MSIFPRGRHRSASDQTRAEISKEHSKSPADARRRQPRALSGIRSDRRFLQSTVLTVRCEINLTVAHPVACSGGGQLRGSTRVLHYTVGENHLRAPFCSPSLFRNVFHNGEGPDPAAATGSRTSLCESSIVNSASPISGRLAPNTLATVYGQYLAHKTASVPQVTSARASCRRPCPEQVFGCWSAESRLRFSTSHPARSILSFRHNSGLELPTFEFSLTIGMVRASGSR